MPRAYLCTRKGLFTLDSAPAGVWTISRISFPGDPVLAVASRGDEIFAALRAGHYGPKLFRSRDGGANWAAMDTPVYPEQPAPGPGDPDVAWKLDQIWTLEIDAHGDLWAGTLPGGLFRWTESGGWELIESLWHLPDRRRWMGGGFDLPGIHSILFDPRDPDAVTVGVSCGGVWHSPDRGVRWELRASGMVARYMPPGQQDDPGIQDPHRIARCAAAPDVLWCQHHNGIFRSVDNGRSWTECGHGHFGFGVAAHPADPATAWFVPGESDERRMPVGGSFAVTRTRDGGQSFEVLKEGLPQDPCYDLVYRHALEVDRSGEQLLFGSTTGNVYASANGGDSWTQLTVHFPPVYALRYA